MRHYTPPNFMMKVFTPAGILLRDVLATDQHTIPYLFGVAYINQDTVVNYKSTGIFLTNHSIVDNFNRHLRSFVMPLTYHGFVGNLCWRTTSPSVTSVDELQARRWLLLTNYKPVGDFCWRTTSPSVTSVDELQARRWLLLTNYKSVGGFCWRTTSPSVSAVDELQAHRWPLWICWYLVRFVDLITRASYKPSPSENYLTWWPHCRTMSELQAQPNWSKLLLPTIEMLFIGQFYL